MPRKLRDLRLREGQPIPPQTTTKSVTSDTTVGGSDVTVIPVDTTDGPVTVTLGEGLQLPGATIRILDTGGNASTARITVDGGAALINGRQTAIIDAPYEALELSYLKQGWSITSRFAGSTSDSNAS